MSSGITLRADHKRYFSNSYETDASLLAQYCTDEWLTEMIEQLTARLTSRQVGKDECEEGGPYTGVAGIGFALLKVGQAIPERLRSSVEMCNQMLSMQLAYSKVAIFIEYISVTLV